MLHFTRISQIFNVPHFITKVTLFLFFTLSLGNTAFTYANETLIGDHVRIRWLAPEQFAADPAAQNATLGIYFEPEPEWHVYWRNPGDSGAAPRFALTSENLTLGEVMWPYPARLPIAHLVNLGYERDVAYLFKAGVEALELRTQQDRSQTAFVKAELEWLVCKEECIPGFGTLTLDRPIRGDNHIWQTNNKALVERFHARIPHSEAQSPWRVRCAYWGDSGVLSVKLESRQNNALTIESNMPDVFPLDGNFIEAGSPSVERDGQTVIFRFKTVAGVLPPATTGFVIAAEGQAWEFSSIAIKHGAFSDQEPLSFWLLLLSALLGGVLLNLMPCVFPVLSIKLFSLINASDRDLGLFSRRLREGLLYTAGVLFTFVGLGVIFLVLRAGGAAIGWGFQLQSPTIVMALILLFWLMALSFLGFFEFGSRIMQMAGSNHSGSSFVTGMLAVFVAAPCTGPFMGAALGAAATLPAYSAMAIFVGLGLGLAAPFLLLAISPTLSSRLPKPGQWMESLRQFLAFPLFATVLWLLWVLEKLLDENVWILVCCVILLLSFAIWLNKSSRHFWRIIAGIVAVVAVLWGFNTLHQILPGDSKKTLNSNSWQAYNSQVITQARAEGRGVFIDFTAAWCITCQVNKKVVLDTQAADQLFDQHNVLRMRADWTRYDAEITAALAAFGRNSVPVYVYYPADGSQPKILPQILTLDILKNLF